MANRSPSFRRRQSLLPKQIKSADRVERVSFGVKFMKIPIQSLYGFYRSAIRNTRYRWWIILGTLVYLLSPIDISPDVFPIVGEIDDFILVTLMMSEVSQLVFERFRSRSEEDSASTPKTTHTIIDVDSVSVD
jgi:uncharacterized membrane protein YkvA (DUF1232 family)